MSTEYQHRSQFFARRQGRPLSTTQEALLSHVLPQMQYTAATPFPPKGKKRIFEFGFGKGDAMLHRLAQDPDVSFVATEVFRNSLAYFLSNLPEKDRDRVRLHTDDGFPLLDQLPENSLDEIWLLNPDPWHKKRHWKRRFVQTERLKRVVQLLKPGGVFFTTTDVPPLAEWTIEHLIREPGLEWTAESKADWETPPQGWLPTSYELKGAKGAEKMSYFTFKKI